MCVCLCVKTNLIRKKNVKKKPTSWRFSQLSGSNQANLLNTPGTYVAGLVSAVAILSESMSLFCFNLNRKNIIKRMIIRIKIMITQLHEWERLASQLVVSEAIFDRDQQLQNNAHKCTNFEKISFRFFQMEKIRVSVLLDFDNMVKPMHVHASNQMVAKNNCPIELIFKTI